jgi:hypothetical protein
MAQTPETQEIRELVTRGLKLSAEAREEVALELLESLEPPPLDWETIRRRIEDIESGRVVALTREQAEEEVRLKMRELGLEL